MDQIGVMSEEAWASLSGMYTCKEEGELLTQLLSGFSYPNELAQAAFWPNEETSYDSSSMEMSRDMTMCFADESNLVGSNSEYPSNSTECFFSQGNRDFGSPDDGQSVLFLEGTFRHSDRSRQMMFLVNDFSESSKVGENSGGSSPTGDNRMDDLSDITGFEIKPVFDFEEPREVDNISNALEESKKRFRDDDHVDKSKKVVKSHKYRKVVAVASENEAEKESGRTIVKRKSPVSTKEESNGSTEATGGETPTTKISKTRKASKGASSDPQSLYARKRRERINERLRILQGLVPNGTKVDISTMLEEAVHYVKFLQLQIKLLSSDETWMYAPLAYNGMDIGIGNFDTINTSPR